jgi:hypothetical protein
VRLPAFFRNPETGEVVVAQWPNVPLWLFIGASIGARLADSGPLRVGASAALAWWSIAEIVDGDSPFRRVLGGAVLAVTIIGLLAR